MVYILLGDGFEEIEALATCDILRRGGVDTALAALSGTSAMGAHQICVQADLPLAEIDFDALEMVIIPGGWGGVKAIEACDAAMALIEKAWNAGRYVAAICAGPTALAKLHITDGKQATCYPGLEDMMGSAVMQAADAVQDGKLITGRAPGAAIPFALKVLAELKGEEKAAEIAAGLVLEH
ncbi:MAG: DJ-1/PfpI family protein [Oscillospiraceae bacterium]|nr:DJ-1/PfpI family protein [Oscillospiraceae bacterium]